MKKLLCFLMMCFAIFAFVGCGANNNTPSMQDPPAQEQPEDSDNIGVNNMNLKIGNHNFVVCLEDNATAKALVKMLPLTMNMSELNGNEKYYYLPNNLPTNPSRVSHINAGDVMLFGNNCLVVFYKSFSTSYSYTKIGHIEDASNLASNLGTGSVFVEFSA